MKQENIHLPIAAQRRIGQLLCQDLRNFHNKQWMKIQLPKLLKESGFFLDWVKLPPETEPEIYIRNYQGNENETVMTIVVGKDRFIAQFQLHDIQTSFIHCSEHCEETRQLHELLECTLARQENPHLDRVLSLALFQIGKD